MPARGPDGAPAGRAAPGVLDAWLMRRCGAREPALLPAALQARQTELFRATAERARRLSRFYRERFRALAPEFFSSAFSPADAAALPCTRPEDLLDWKRFLCISQSGIERMVTLESSGTSGPPKRLAFSRSDLEATKEFFRVGMSLLLRPGERALTLWPGARRPDGVGDLLRRALEEDGIAVAAGNPCPDAHSLRREMEEHRPHAVVAAPGQLAVLLELLSSTPEARAFAPSGILSSAETLPPALADALNRRFGCLVLDHYGLTESGYGGGVECPAHDGYHLRELDLFVEIVDPESDAPLPDGQEGEIVITTLGREAMPLIRYRTGDAASMRPGPCNCGSPLRRLSPVRGRIIRCHGGYRVKNMKKAAFRNARAEGAGL